MHNLYFSLCPEHESPLEDSCGCDSLIFVYMTLKSQEIIALFSHTAAVYSSKVLLRYDSGINNLEFLLLCKIIFNVLLFFSFTKSRIRFSTPQTA